jgi:hypothetical protein
VKLAVPFDINKEKETAISLFRFGMATANDRAYVQHYTNLEFLNYLNTEPFEFYVKVDSASGADPQDLDTTHLQPGWIYFLHNIIGLESGSGITQCSLGYVSGGTFMVMKKESTDNPYQTVEFHGQIVLKQGDQIRARFHGATATDKLELFANGIKRKV